MSSFAPNPRYRIYGGITNYISTLWDLVTGGKDRGLKATQDFERQLAEYFKVSHAICVPQNRVGVYHTIKATITPGQYVVMSPYTIADIINMVILAGGKPLFADTERETCNIAASEVKLLLEQYDNIGAVLVTHLHGLAAPTHEILKLCEAHHVPMIEDAAQGFGAKERGVKLGTIGKAGVFSFGMYKNINTWLGGAVVTNDDELATQLRSELSQYDLQGWGLLLKKLKKGVMMGTATFPLLFKSFTFWIFRYAFLHDIEAINKMVRTELDTSRKQSFPPEYQARYSPSQARNGIRQLPGVDNDSKVRIENARIYHEGLRDIPGLIIPPWRDDYSHIYTYFPVQYADRDELLKWLMAHNRDIAAQHYKNCADEPQFKDFYRDCPNSRAIAQQLIFLPTYPRYGADEVKENVKVIQGFFAQEHIRNQSLKQDQDDQLMGAA